MSNIFERGMAWHTFLGLEKDLIATTRYVALAPENGATWSEKIAQLLLLVGSTVGSVFNEMRKSPLLPQTKTVTNLKKKDEPNIIDYREAYEPTFLLSGVEVQAHHGLTNYGVIKPFEAFLHKNSPDWWSAYNDVKHEFFANVSKGTLNNLVHSLGGLFVLNALHKDSQQYLVRRGIIRVGEAISLLTYQPGYDEAWNEISGSFIGVAGNLSYDYWISSEIFHHVFRKDPNVRV
jgi:hypothetical protein